MRWEATQDAGGCVAAQRDCAGQCDGEATQDDCVCDADANNNNTTCVQDCNGDWGGDATVDDCGECDANPDNDCIIPEGDLFFSEYVEGSGNNKALELFNNFGEVLDLTLCQVEIYANGAQQLTRTINLGDPNGPEMGMILDQDTYVLCHSSADQEILEVCDQATGSLSFNGNDAVVLTCDEFVLDTIGQIGVDPGGNGWSNGDRQYHQYNLTP